MDNMKGNLNEPKCVRVCEKLNRTLW